MIRKQQDISSVYQVLYPGWNYNYLTFVSVKYM